MKKSLTGWILTSQLLLSLFALLSTRACDMPKSRRVIFGSWKVASETRDVGDFRKVFLAYDNTADLHIKVGSKTALRIEADDNILPYISAKITNGILELSRAPGVHLEPRRRVKYYLTATELDSIEACGMGSVFASDLKSKQLSLTTHSGYYSFGTLTAAEVIINPGGQGQSITSNPSNVEIGAIYADKLKVQNNTNSDIYVGKGKVGRQEVIITNEGNYKAPDLECAAAEVRMNAEGTATIRVDKTLTANFANYSGDVRYIGNPVVTQTRQSDVSGKLIKIQD